MDTTGFSQVGRYGTLSLLKKQSASGAAVAESTTKSKDAASSPGPQVITSFGIDSANLTFGSSLQCDVRLYYPTVDAVHCRLVNEDGKAFLAVQGKSGALIDGSWVYPSTSATSSNKASEETQQTITPLMNNSEFEIHSKRFRFTYPPKEVRKVLLSTPVAQRNRTLRLSMIHSAQVFTPRPSKDPRENLRILQSPIKASIFGVGSVADASARDRSISPNKPRAVSPLKFGIGADDDSSDEDLDDDEERVDISGDNTDETHIVLVHTNHPRVVEEDRDLVILEDVPLHLVLPSPSIYSSESPARRASQRGGPPGTPTPVVAPPQPQLVQPQPPRTPPRRKSMGGTALHRAVLIRSAQRAVWRAEKDREDEEEEMEVLDAVVAAGGKRDVEHDDDVDDVDEMEDDDISEDEQEHDQEDVEMRSVSDDSLDSLDMDGSDEEGDVKDEDKPLWKKSLEKIIPWPFSPKKESHSEEHKVDEEPLDDDDDEQEHADEVLSLPVLPQQQQTPIRRVLGSFMTPQARQPAQQASKGIFAITAAANASHATESSALAPAVTASGPGRYSLGGGEAQRILVQQPWRVKDLVVPPIVVGPQPSTALRAMDPPSTPDTAPGAGFPSATASASTSRITSARPSITEEERKAIQERRRSAVREVREDTFWKDGAPGMSPSKSRPSLGPGTGGSSPVKAPPGLTLGLGRPSSSAVCTPAMTPRKGVLASPTKGRSLGYAIPEADAEEDGHSVFLDKPTASSSGSMTDSTTLVAASKAKDEDDNESTSGLFERMRETVEDMKRRRSSVAPLATPRTSLLDGERTGVVAAPGSGWRESIIRGSVKKLDFSRITPAQPARTGRSLIDPSLSADVEAEATPPTRSRLSEKENDEEDNGKGDEPEPFSLLRPGTRASMSLSPTKRHDFGNLVVKKEKKEEDEVMQGVPTVVVESVHETEVQPAVVDEELEPKARGRTRGRSRLLRVPKEPEEVIDEQLEEDGQESTQSKPKSSSKPTSRAKPPSSSKPRSRAAKSPSPAPAPTPSPETLAPEPSGSGPRRLRSRTPQARSAEEKSMNAEPEAEAEVEQAHTRSGARRTTQKGTVEPEEPVAKRTTRRGTTEPEEPAARRTTRKGTAEPEEPAIVAPKRKGRKVDPGPEPETEVEVEVEAQVEITVEVEEQVIEKVKPTPKRGRKPRAMATPVPAAIEEEEEEAPAPPTVKRGRPKKIKDPVVPTRTAQEDDDDFDSYEVSTPAAPASAMATTSKKPSKIPGKIPTLARGRKAAEIAAAAHEPEVEEQDEEEPVPLATTRAGRGARTNANATALKTPVPVSKSKISGNAATTTAAGKTAVGASKPRGRPKTPASAPAAATTSASAADIAEKENARGAGSGSANGSDEEPTTKVRVSRKAGVMTGSGKATKTTTSKTKAKPKAEQNDDDEAETIAPAGRPRATRIMRTRTKTG